MAVNIPMAAESIQKSRAPVLSGLGGNTRGKETSGEFEINITEFTAFYEYGTAKAHELYNTELCVIQYIKSLVPVIQAGSVIPRPRPAGG